MRHLVVRFCNYRLTNKAIDFWSFKPFLLRR